MKIVQWSFRFFFNYGVVWARWDLLDLNSSSIFVVNRRLFDIDIMCCFYCTFSGYHLFLRVQLFLYKDPSIRRNRYSIPCMGSLDKVSIRLYAIYNRLLKVFVLHSFHIACNVIWMNATLSHMSGSICPSSWWFDIYLSECFNTI